MKVWLLLAAAMFLLSANASHSNDLLLYGGQELVDEEGEDDDFDDEEDEEFSDFYGDEDFISIATGTKIQIHKAPSVATVITSQDIERMGAVTVFDALESVVGLHVYPSNLNRMNNNISIRGLHTAQNPQVLILVNGKTTYNPYDGTTWNGFHMATGLIERIEIIRGPGSAVYGADAYSGVINIITKGVQSPSTLNFGAQVGSFNSQSSWLNYVNSDDELKLSFNAQWFKTDGDKSRVVQTDRMHQFGLGHLSNAPGPLDTRKDMIDVDAQLEYNGFYLNAWYLRNDGGTGAGAAQALSTGDTDIGESFTITSGYKWEVNSELSANFKVYHQSFEEKVSFVIYPAGMLLPRAPDEDGNPQFTVFTEGLIGEPSPDNTNYGTNLIFNYSGIEKHNIRAEVGYRNSDEKYSEKKNFGNGVLDGSEEFVDGTLTEVRGTPYIYMQDQQRDVHFLSLQTEWQLAPDWDFTIGGRYDKYSDFGSTFNPRLALVWQTGHNLTTKFLYGEAFRAPSFSELYAVNNPVLLGNPELEPETINTYEIAWDYRPAQEWQIVASLFSYEAKKLARNTPDGTGRSQFQNVGSQDGYGAEVEARWDVNEDIEIRLGYSYQNSTDGDTDADIADAPGQMFSANINWRVTEQLNMNFDTRWIMDRKRAFGDTRDEIGDYNWSNLSLIYDFSKELDMRLSVRNLFDSNVYEASDGRIPDDYPMEERGVWASFNYSW